MHRKIKKLIIDIAFVLNYRAHVAVEHCTLILIYSTVHDCGLIYVSSCNLNLQSTFVVLPQ